MQVGDRWERVVVEDLSRTQIVMYAGASGDFHPVHHDEVFAQATGYPTIFAHGMLTMGLTGRLVEEVAGERLLRYAGRMTAQVWPGDTLTATLVVTSVADGTAELEVRTVDQHGRTVLTGSASVRLDG